jgi:hypothetical protein
VIYGYHWSTILLLRAVGPDFRVCLFEGDVVQALVRDFNHMAEGLES